MAHPLRPTPRLVAAALAVPMALALALVVPQGRAEAAPAPVRFTAAGDYNATATTHTVLTGIAAAAPDLNLALGDLMYGSSTEEQVWCDYVTARVGASFPFELLAGNHESDGTLDGFIDEFAACLPNRLPGLVGTYGRQWYVDHPAQDPTVRFVMISPGLTFPDGTWSYAAGTPRHQWTANAIDGARAAGIPWVVVGLHKPCISMGQYGCDGQNDINNLLVSKKVDLVLNGHEHHYQRSKQLALGTGCTALTVNGYNAACVADADDTLVRGAGTVFATVGTGGTPLRNVNTADTEAGYFRAFSGANRSPSHGFLDVAADATTLTARFTPTTGSFTDTVTIGSGTPQNQPPAAAIGVTCTGLTCAFDGSGSADPDGTVASYAWTFGDGGTATGVRPSRTYAAAGTYTVGLTVTDDDGATGSMTRQVTVTSGTPTPVATDTFSRNVTGGLGTADLGGAWTVTGPAADAAVSGGTGRLVLRAPGQGQLATLATMPRTSRGDLDVTLGTDKPATGSGIYLSAVARRVSGSGDYRAKLRLTATGAVQVSVERTSATGAETNILPPVTVPGLAYAAGDRLRLRVQAVGTAPTQLRTKVWRAGATEPASWLLSGADATAALQTTGVVGLQTYLSSSATNAPITAVLDDLRATAVP